MYDQKIVASILMANNSAVCLGYTSSGLVVGSYSDSNDSYKWLVTSFGVDAPLIKQNKNYTCGAATALQVLIGNEDDEYNWNLTSDLKDCIDRLFKNGGVEGGGMSATTLLNLLNAKSDTKQYVRYECDKVTISTVREKLLASMQNGTTGALHVNTNKLYTNGYPGGHYVAVVGYDSITDRVLIADCSCFTKYFGLYMKSMQTVYNASFSAFLE